MSDWFVDALVDSVQPPGPSSGTSTDSNPGPSVPESAPLIALTFDIGATGLSVEVVTLENLLSTDDELFVVLAATVTSVVGVVALIVEVVVLGTWVVTGDVEEGGGDEAAGARGDVEVRVKTSTISRRGLDHVKRCALFREKGGRVMVFEG